MTRSINSVAVIGAGTMGTGIAGKCADAGCRVLLLDVDRDTVDAAMHRMTDGRPPAIDNPDRVNLIETGTFDDLAKIADYDWICEAVIEDLATKRDMFTKLEHWRSDGSVISTNTSGIPLRSITEGMTGRLRRDVVVTHFFNPVKVMKLLEIVPGEETTPDVVEAMAAFCSTRLDKGVVHAKDTVNFIGNRIGCFWMLSGLHKARKARREGGLQMEEIDALMSAPVGLPPTGLYGLIDLIGLDVMDLVGKNLAANLPAGDTGHLYTTFPEEEQAMLARGQLGRKTRGGFYRVTRTEDGERLRETFDLDDAHWRPSTMPGVAADASTPRELMTASGAAGDFARDLMGGVLAYAAGLVGEISDDIVNIDRAMRWGFAWKRGPFELIDDIGHDTLATFLETLGEPLPAMLRVARDAGASTFHDGDRFLGLDGHWHDLGD
ncbi:MAG: 3-hydroxyacyl-CoA dehydrogenase NAD-binding domain-containing protein [bacterium]|nr:3-hydroxyacyl-CoA dehydrogenase NAD-binding domain-containing protein [bacterium]